MYYTIYKTTNLINGKFYIGKHQTKNLDDGYMGSGINIKSAIAKYGLENFKKDILYIFETEEEMNAKEKELVTGEFCQRENTYNLCEGGKGGFGYINASGINLGSNNVMNRSPEIKTRVILAGKKTRSSNKEFYDNISRNNFAISHEKRRGTKDPNHGIKMKMHFTEYWKNNKEEMRDKLSSTFIITTPSGETIETNRLQDWCKENNIPHVSLWNTSRTGKILLKGKGKGYSCQKI